MKTLPLLPAALLAFLAPSAALSVYAATSPQASARTEIVFSSPENFADVKETAFSNEKDRDAILKRIRDFIVDRADRALPAGHKLTMTFTDIDLAGEFEPWRAPQMSDVRIVKAIYPPRLKFTYKITNEAGQVVKEGEENIVDQSFDQRVTMERLDPLRYEKDILSDWISRVVAAPKK